MKNKFILIFILLAICIKLAFLANASDNLASAFQPSSIASSSSESNLIDKDFNKEKKNNDGNNLEYIKGDIIVKYKKDKTKDLIEILNGKKLKSGIRADGFKEKIEEKKKEEKIDLIQIYQSTDLKEKAELFEELSVANIKKTEKLFKEQSEKNVLYEKDDIDPYTKEMIDELNKNQDIEYAEVNRLVYAVELIEEEGEEIHDQDYNDNNYYSKMWNLENIGQNYPIARNVESSGGVDSDIDVAGGWVLDQSDGGLGIIVAVIDSGVDYTHEEFGSCSIEDINDNDQLTCPKFVPGYDFVNNDNNPVDDYGHGTFCAGIIGAMNNNKGIIGIAYNAKIMPLKVLSSSGVGSVWDTARAVRWAADNGADVINLSLGGYYKSETVRDAFQYAYNKGVVSIAAAGNGYGQDTLNFSPAMFSEVIAVGASDSFDKLAKYSNKGPKIDVVAPGSSILSLLAGDNGSSDYFIYKNSYYISSGTSAAAPHVAGAAVLIKANNPNYETEEIRQALRSGANDLGKEGFDENFGYGRLNIENSLAINGEIPNIKLIYPWHNDVIDKKLDISGYVGGGDVFLWGIYYQKIGGDLILPFNGTGCSGDSAPGDFSCDLSANSLENGDYNIILKVSNGEKDFYDYRKVAVDIEDEDFEYPSNLMANEENPSKWQENDEFIIDWDGATSSYPIVWYKLGLPPNFDENGTSTAIKPFTVHAQEKGGQSLYVWFENIYGEKDYLKSVAVNLRYDPEFYFLSPQNLTANGENSSPVNMSGDFIINWDNPEVAINIAGARYKLDDVPEDNNDGIFIDKKPFNLSIDKPGEHILYVWLEDMEGDKNYSAAKKVKLNYFEGFIDFPKNVKASPVDKKVELSWNPPTEAEGLLAGYNVYQSESFEDFTGNHINEVLIEEESYAVLDLDNWKTYYFALKAVDIYGSESDFSETVFASPYPGPYLQIGEEIKISNNGSWNVYPDIFEDNIVWSGDGQEASDIYAYDIKTEVAQRISANSSGQYRPAIFGNKIVWEDYRNEESNIYMYNMETGDEARISENLSGQFNPDIFGNKIVWIDNRSGDNEIYLYDLDSGAEERIGTGFSSPLSPKIYEDKIIWADYKYGENKTDIYLYDLENPFLNKILENLSGYFIPDIYKDTIVWRNYSGGVSDIYIYDLGKEEKTRISYSGGYKQGPSIYNNKIVWSYYSGEGMDIYLYDISTKNE